MSKAAKKKTKVPKITEEEYAEYIFSLKAAEPHACGEVSGVDIRAESRETKNE